MQCRKASSQDVTTTEDCATLKQTRVAFVRHAEAAAQKAFEDLSRDKSERNSRRFGRVVCSPDPF